MAKSQRSLEDIERYGELAEQEIAQRARARGLVALLRTTCGKKRMKFVNRDFNAVIKIR
jgi:hypothetical protein